tara:strand:- start:713 stop:880 length:168 start_codon:yes stop_codon:yes gene_type:complete
MSEIKTWQIIQNTTMGWEKLNEPGCTGLSKEQCKVRLEQLMNEGFNPNDLKAVPD